MTRISAVPHIAAMTPYALADLSVPAGKRLISLAQNESLRGPGPLAVQAARQALCSAQLYPDPDWVALRGAIAEVHGVPAGTILCGAGSMELIGCLAHAYGGPGARILSTQYGYAFFRTAAEITNAGFDIAPETGFTVGVDALLSAVRANTKMVFLANPGNPTGTRISADEIRRLRNGLDARILLVVDEAYGEFADGQDAPVFDLARQGNTVVLRTFSKAYGLAGMRVGWGVFPGPVAAEIRKILNPNNISAASQAGACAAMQDQDYMKETCAITASLRESFTDQLRALGLAVERSHTNFVLIRFAGEQQAQSACRALRAEGILMRGMGSYGLRDCLRATVGSSADMAFAARVLSDWLAGEDPR